VKKNLRSTFLTLSLTLLCLPNSQIYAANLESTKSKKIIIASDEWCPYNCAPEAKDQGFMVEIARAAFKLSNIEIEYQTSNWSRVLKLTREGQIEGALGSTADEASENGLTYGAEPMAQSYFAFIVRKDSDFVYQDLTSLDKISFGIIQDYDNGPDIAKYMAGKPKNVVVQVGNNAFEKNIRLVTAGRIDAAIDDSSYAAYALTQMGLRDQTKLVALDKEPIAIAIAFSPTQKGKILAATLDKGIRKLRASGDLAKILAKYGQRDWK